MRVRAVEHGDLLVAEPRCVALLDLTGYPATFITLVGCHEHLNLLAFVVARGQTLRLPVHVVGDDCVRGIQNVARGAVILLQLHGGALGIVALELEDVAQVGATPGIDGLVVVADHHDVAMRCRKQAAYLVLRVVRVLILVYKQIPETVLICVENVGVMFQEQVRI